MRKSIVVFLLGVLAIAAAQRLAGASSITFEAPSISLQQEPYDQTGFFDVTINETGGSDVLSQFVVDLWLPQVLGNPNPYVTFICADYSTTVPYVYAGDSYNIDNDQPVDVALNRANNIDNPDFGEGRFLTSAPLGLMRVEYSIAPNFVGSVRLTLAPLDYADNTYGSYVNLNNNFDTNIIPTLVSGSITVTPEPSSWLLGCLAICALLIYRGAARSLRALLPLQAALAGGVLTVRLQNGRSRRARQVWQFVRFVEVFSNLS